MLEGAPHPGICLRRITKAFGAHRILNEISIDLAPGEVHVLVGANGAGKSTLIRILSGADSEYQGEIWCGGQRLFLRNPREGQLAGIHVIYQELSLVGCLSAVDNWILTQPVGAFRGLSRVLVRERVIAQCERLGLKLDVDLPVERLPLSERQLLEIGRALSGQAKVLVFDEPTSALTESDAERLLTQIQGLRALGTAILYVSHRMEEIYRLADRISVLRDGVLVLSQPANRVSRDELVQAMVGQASDASHGRAPRDQWVEATERRLEVEHLSVSGRPGLRDISFTARAHEILGVCGLSGSGVSELLEVLGGVRKRTTGVIQLAGAPMRCSSSKQAFAAGIAYLPADRRLSVFAGLNLIDNASLSTLARYSRFGVVRRETRERELSPLASTLGLGQYGLDTAAGTLSGGNQQKLALLRCLASNPRLLLLAEPTRGVDISAKRAIHERIREIARTGPSVIVQSSELEELVVLCDRVLVLYQGELVASVERSQLDRQHLLSLMMGHRV